MRISLAGAIANGRDGASPQCMRAVLGASDGQRAGIDAPCRPMGAVASPKLAFARRNLQIAGL